MYDTITFDSTLYHENNGVGLSRLVYTLRRARSLRWQFLHLQNFREPVHNQFNIYHHTYKGYLLLLWGRGSVDIELKTFGHQAIYTNDPNHLGCTSRYKNTSILFFTWEEEAKRLRKRYLVTRRIIMMLNEAAVQLENILLLNL